MNRVAQAAFVGARGFDTIATIDATHAASLRAWGMQFAVRYLGSLTTEEVDVLLAAELAVMPVTYGVRHGTVLDASLGTNFGFSSLHHAQVAGLPQGVTVWLDLESCTGTAADVIEFVSSWTSPIIQGGYMPGLYVGAGALLSSAELYALPVVRYWQSLSKETDARGNLAEPNCGWTMIQLYNSIVAGGVLVDVDVVQKDYRNRLPMWCVAA
jgi:hypothetical protein